MKRIPRNERGMALAVAIFALVVVGALVAGAFFAGTQEQRVGENQRRVQTSFGVAEAGAQERVLSWDPNTMNKRPVYPLDSVAIAPTNGSAQGATWLFKGKIRCQSSGHYGYTVRVLPRNTKLGNPYEPGLVCWG